MFACENQPWGNMNALPRIPERHKARSRACRAVVAERLIGLIRVGDSALRVGTGGGILALIPTSILFLATPPHSSLLEIPNSLDFSKVPTRKIFTVCMVACGSHWWRAAPYQLISRHTRIVRLSGTHIPQALFRRRFDLRNETYASW